MYRTTATLTLQTQGRATSPHSLLWQVDRQLLVSQEVASISYTIAAGETQDLSALIPGGLVSFVALRGDQPFDVSIRPVGAGADTYSGVFGTVYLRLLDTQVSGLFVQAGADNPVFLTGVIGHGRPVG